MNRKGSRIDTSRPVSGEYFLEFAPRIIARHYLDAATGCWNWNSTINGDGYGIVAVRQQTYNAHRISYLLFSGPFANELHVHHVCRNRACVNPDHLEAITETENVRKCVHDKRMGVKPRPSSLSLRAMLAAKQQRRGRG